MNAASGLTRATNAADSVARRIETMIAEGTFGPGQRLPSERQLCERLGVSRAALREGLRILRGRGIIDTHHGKGSTVARLLPRPNDEALLYLFREYPRTLFDLLEVRSLLEGESARLAALRATPADIVVINRRFEALNAYSHRDAPIDVHHLARYDHAFHLAICEASHNPVMAHTLRGLTDLLLSSVFASVNNLYHREAPRRRIDRQHARLHRAVVNRQPAAARRAALDHLRSISHDLRAIEREEQQLVRASLHLHE